VKIDFNGQVALVTGGTRGIGQQIAEDLFDLGANLILTGTNNKQIEELNRSLPAEKRKRIKYIAADFKDSESIKKFTEELADYEKIDVCVNNAGINRINFIDETLLEDWDDILTVNLKAPFMIIRAIANTMKKNNYGRIVNIASIFGVVSRVKRSIYSTFLRDLSSPSLPKAYYPQRRWRSWRFRFPSEGWPLRMKYRVS